MQYVPNLDKPFVNNTYIKTNNRRHKLHVVTCTIFRIVRRVTNRAAVLLVIHELTMFDDLKAVCMITWGNIRKHAMQSIRIRNFISNNIIFDCISYQ